MPTIDLIGSSPKFRAVLADVDRIAPVDSAVLIQGDDHLGAVADIYKCLSEAGVAIYASSGVTDGGGRFGYVIYFRQDDYREAARAIAAAAMKI